MFSAMINSNLIFCVIFGTCVVSSTAFDVQQALSYAVRQYSLLAKSLENDDRFISNGNRDNSEWVMGNNSMAWTVGFYGGSLWKLYKLTNDTYWKDQALHKQEIVKHRQYDTNTHDVGFVIMSTFGNALAITGDKSFEPIIIQAANSLATRFHAAAGVFRSWNNDAGHGGVDGEVKVIADNMMNLDLMFTATKLTGNQSYAEMAISHAERTIQNHFRENGKGTFHVVAYDESTGAVKRKYNWQGYGDNSTWARGLAWVIHGYTTTYEHTRTPIFLEYAEKAAKYFVDNLPEDWIPYYDFDCPYREMYQPRDTSAAAIAAHALLKLFAITKKAQYFQNAKHILESLFSTNYRADGKDAYKIPAILVNGTVFFREGNFNTAIVYGDMYFLESIDLYSSGVRHDAFLMFIIGLIMKTLFF